MVVLQVIVELSPSSIDVGLAVIEQVGAGGVAVTVTVAEQLTVEPLFPTKVPV